MSPAPTLACGGCMDVEFLRAFPFFFYWTVVFLGWLLIGSRVAVWARLQGNTLPISAPRWLLWSVVTLVCLCLLLAGSIAVPLAIIECAWLYRLARSLIERREMLRAQARDVIPAPPEERKLKLLRVPLVRFAYSLQTIALMACLGLVVPAYLRLIVRMKELGY
jgi:hypothetical protein